MKLISISLLAAIAACLSSQTRTAADSATYKETVLWSFGSGTDGQYPRSSLINVNGTLYGTTAGGGIYGDGTVFALDPATGAEKVVYFFCVKGEYCLDGDQPWADLIDVKGELYGTTVYGGANCQGDGGCGTVFSLDPNTGKEKVIYSFSGSDGSGVVAGLLHMKSSLYGTTDTGGASDFGVAFKLDRKTRAESVLYSFCSQPHCTDGKNPGFGVIDVNGALYGATAGGGADYTGCQNAGCGAVFSLDPKTGAETVVHSFQGGNTDGSIPEGNPINVGGTLYGTTYWGGGTGCFHGFGCGTVYALDLNTGAETILYSFCSQQNCKDGAEPSGNLVAVNGTLYGTTQAGGADYTGCQNSGCGIVFSLDPKTGTETVLYSFCSKQNCKDGAYPSAALIDVNGKLYGTTYEGGTNNYGTLFELEKR